MITLVTGDFGSGKTTALAARIRARVETGAPCCLLVPEQQTVLSEQAMAALLPPSAPLCFEVSNFTRLANTVFRRVGGLSYRYASQATRTLLMWRAMSELLPLLHETGKEQEVGRVRKMTAAMGELSALSLTPGQLSGAAQKLEQGSRLREKLEDLSLLSTTYHALLREKYNDATEDLDRLATLLEEDDLLCGMSIYIDGFISFTEQEWHVLHALARRADLTVALTWPAAREDDLCFAEAKQVALRLRRMSEQLRLPFVREDVGNVRRMRAPVLRRALSTLFEEGQSGQALPNEAPLSCRAVQNDPLRILSARDAFAAAVFIACDIARRVQEEGAHYRDFAVVARHAESYSGILDVCFERAEIPYFMAQKTDISCYRAVKLIYTAYAVCTGSWRRRDVISYLKCGMSGVAQSEIDLFEMYVTRWRLEGRRFTDEVDWNMDPAGYTAHKGSAAQTADILRRVNAVRHTVVDQLSPLAASCGRQTVAAHARALYRFLLSLSVEEQLGEEAEAARMAGRAAEADALSRLFATLGQALDDLVEAMPNGGDGTLPALVNAEQFVDLLHLLLGEVSLSRIPTSVDEVTVGSADLLRLSQARHVYLLGVNEGEFPAPVEESGLFHDSDRRRLRELGLSIEPDLLLRSAREYFCFARAFAAGSESVTLLFYEQKPNGEQQNPATVLCRLLARGVAPLATVSGRPRLDYLWRKRAAADYLGLFYGTAEGTALAGSLQDEPAYARTVRGLSLPLVEATCHLSPQTTERLFAGGLYLSQSRIDQFARCPFSYFCRYVLKLEDDRPISFDYAEVGNLLHTVLEEFFACLATRGLSPATLTEDELKAIVDEVVDAYIRRVCPNEALRSARLMHLFARLRRTVGLVARELCNELAESEFTPRFFELDLTEGEDAPGTLTYRLPNGMPIRLGGRIDRVDTWRKGNKVYLRVIDYKSGHKDFSLEQLERGLDTQLLLYLFSLWKSENPAFRRRLCGEGEEPVPAGVLYTHTGLKEGLYDDPRTAAAHALEDACKGVRRSGLLLDDKEVLAAMDKKLEGRYIPIRFRADGTVDRRSEKSLASLEKMGELVGQLEGVICRIGSEIGSGEASARPLENDRRVRACQYCEMKAVCRSSSLG